LYHEKIPGITGVKVTQLSEVLHSFQCRAHLRHRSCSR